MPAWRHSMYMRERCCWLVVMWHSCCHLDWFLPGPPRHHTFCWWPVLGWLSWFSMPKYNQVSESKSKPTFHPGFQGHTNSCISNHLFPHATLIHLKQGILVQVVAPMSSFILVNFVFHAHFLSYTYQDFSVSVLILFISHTSTSVLLVPVYAWRLRWEILLFMYLQILILYPLVTILFRQWNTSLSCTCMYMKTELWFF